jgi:hypothetical protein
MHVSNRHLELSSVVVGIAEANDLRAGSTAKLNRDNEYIFATSVVVSARGEIDVGKLASSEQWVLTGPTVQRSGPTAIPACSARVAATARRRAVILVRISLAVFVRERNRSRAQSPWASA